MRRTRIDFMGLRKVFFGISIALVLISIGAIAIRGLTFGIEFQGGTVIDISKSQDVSIEKVRKAFDHARRHRCRHPDQRGRRVHHPHHRDGPGEGDPAG